jgi:hypothetical protein
LRAVQIVFARGAKNPKCGASNILPFWTDQSKSAASALQCKGASPKCPFLGNFALDAHGRALCVGLSISIAGALVLKLTADAFSALYCLP